ncbi:hypothetical protein MRB53_007064 [Persea americana]|uniref:Uncharacterized protein n=1 Tax=Persea americana TaxID=3435 RepID=A0ACC2MI73_PERAE|nr:hypothetical protein MRB53_007064 [Persea americana]
MMGGWRDFGTVETIYEEDSEDLSNSSSPLSPTTSISVIVSLERNVEAWSKATGLEADILVHVHGRCFHLHKDPLTSKSHYIKRQLTESSFKTVHLPSCITLETFTLVGCFCYNMEVVITPFNVVPLHVAAELLEMDDVNDVERNLRHITEAYFSQAVTVNGEYANVVLRQCLGLLPETAFLASRCIEALVVIGSVDGVSNGLIDGVKSMTFDEFHLVANSMKGRFTRNHDLLYKVVVLFLKEHSCNLTEEQKNRICCAVDCNKLSQHLLMDAVQNPEMPLRFVIRAMLVEQLNTRHTFDIASIDPTSKPQNNCATLGAILQRDAAVRYNAQLKATMEATSARIISLEHELISMKKRLHESGKKSEVLDSTKSASCRFSWEVKKGDMGMKAATSPPMERARSITTPRTGKSFSQKLMSGLKNAFWTSKANVLNSNLD